MFEQKPRLKASSGGDGVFQNLLLRIKLILRLMGDERVSPWLKLLPVFSFIYLLIPDIAPGPLDDAAILWLGTALFVELCPPYVVQEHLEELTGVIPGTQRDPLEDEAEIIEAEFTEEE
jgi:hypothetical protein